MVEYTAAEILAESKKDRKLLHKWEHSFIAVSGDKPVGLIMGYERSGEGNVHVIVLYERFGFTQRARKDYPNRTDMILGYSPELS